MRSVPDNPNGLGLHAIEPPFMADGTAARSEFKQSAQFPASMRSHQEEVHSLWVLNVEAGNT